MERSAFLGAVAAGAFAAPLQARAADLVKVRVGSVPVDGYGQPYFGVAGGIFANAGIDVDVVNLANSGAIAAAVLGGSIDVGLGSPSQLAGAKEKGLPFAVFAPGGVYTPDAPSALLMVLKTSPVNGAKDLTGKTIAVDNLTSFTQFGAVEWLRRNGVDPGSVKFVELPFSTMAAALEANRVDAAIIAEPARSASLATCRILADTNGTIAPQWYISVWFSTQQWLANNTALAHKLAQAVVQTSVWANAHHTETGAALEKASKMPHDVIVKMTRAYFGTKLDPRLMDPLIVLAAKNDMIPSVIPGKSLVYPGFA